MWQLLLHLIWAECSQTEREWIDLPCKKDGISECEEDSQWSSEPSSEHVNRWSGFVGWKRTSHTKQTKYISWYRTAVSIIHLKSNHLAQWNYFQQSAPPWVRWVCCLVSRPRHRACHPALRWSQYAAGWDVCPRNTVGLYPLSCEEDHIFDVLKINITWILNTG